MRSLAAWGRNEIVQAGAEEAAEGFRIGASQDIVSFFCCFFANSHALFHWPLVPVKNCLTKPENVMQKYDSRMIGKENIAVVKKGRSLVFTIRLLLLSGIARATHESRLVRGIAFASDFQALQDMSSRLSIRFFEVA